MPGRDIIVIGASAGGVEALTRLTHALPRDLPAAVFVVLHMPAHAPSALPIILSRNSPLPASHPSDGEEFQQGRIYVAPSDCHMLVQPGKIELSPGPRENRHRPAIDPLFRSAARAYGERVIGVVLSGSLDDGTSGLSSIKMCGGIAVVQDPEDALYPGMPRSAVENVQVDYILPLDEIAPMLVELARAAPDSGSSHGADEEVDTLEFETSEAHLNAPTREDSEHPGSPSAFSCPECHGTLWELQDGEMIRFRCRVGHAYSAESLEAAQADALEDALWAALRALEERAALSRRLAVRARERERNHAAIILETRATAADGRANLLREILLKDITTGSNGR